MYAIAIGSFSVTNFHFSSRNTTINVSNYMHHAFTAFVLVGPVVMLPVMYDTVNLKFPYDLLHDIAFRTHFFCAFLVVALITPVILYISIKLSVP
jgi:hypothetical protein